MTQNLSAGGGSTIQSNWVAAVAYTFAKGTVGSFTPVDELRKFQSLNAPWKARMRQ